MNLFENLQKLKESNYYTYGINYRNMHTGIHGLIIFNDEDNARANYTTLLQLDDVEDNAEYEDIINEVLENSDDWIEEIDYKDIKNNVYDDSVNIVNPNFIDLYGL